jgi:hypothetical protein
MNGFVVTFVGVSARWNKPILKDGDDNGVTC